MYSCLHPNPPLPELFHLIFFLLSTVACFISLFVWVARAAFLAGVYVYAHSPLINALVVSYRRTIGKVVKVGNMDGYGEE